MFMVRGSRVMISFGHFCIERHFPVVLTWSHYSMDKYNIWIVDEMDMIPLQFRYSWGKFLTQILSGTPSTIIYTRWNSWHEGLGWHAPMVTIIISHIMVTPSNANLLRVTGPLCGEFTGHWWIPLTQARCGEPWCSLWSPPNPTVE